MSESPPSRSGSRPRAAVQSVTRAFAILEVLADNGNDVGLSQLASQADLPRATIHRLLGALVDLGYVRQVASRQYRLGPGLVRLADTSNQQLVAIALPHLDGVRRTLGESVNLAVLDGDEVVYLAQVQPSIHLIRMATEVGRRVPPHATAVGKVILAAGPASTAVALLQRTGLPRHTNNTLTSAASVLGDLARVRERGYAVDNGEWEVGVRCVAAAVPNAPRPIAVSVSGPVSRVTDSVVVTAARLLRAAAARLSEDLGAAPPDERSRLLSMPSRPPRERPDRSSERNGESG